MGGLDAALANNVARSPAEHTKLGSSLPYDLAVALTNRRVLLLAMSALTGRPGRVVGAIPLSDLRAVDVATATSLGVCLHRFSLSVSDGSSLSLESRSRGESVEQFCNALASAVSSPDHEGF
jgi:hypothetical protein